MLHKLLLLLLYIASLNACKQKDEKQFGEITGWWRLANEQFQNSVSGFRSRCEGGEGVREGALLSFFSDSKFTLLSGEGKLENGLWSAGKGGLIRNLRFGGGSEG